MGISLPRTVSNTDGGLIPHRLWSLAYTRNLAGANFLTPSLDQRSPFCRLHRVAARNSCKSGASVSAIGYQTGFNINSPATTATCLPRGGHLSAQRLAQPDDTSDQRPRPRATGRECGLWAVVLAAKPQYRVLAKDRGEIPVDFVILDNYTSLAMPGRSAYKCVAVLINDTLAFSFSD